MSNTPGNEDNPNVYFVSSRASMIGIAVVLLAVVGVGIYFNRRIEDVEDRMTARPPQEFKAADLKAFAAGNVPADSIKTSKVVYVPTYSHVYFNQGRPYSLETTLSIRNTNLSKPVYVRSVRYYDTDGKLVKTHVGQAIRLAPLQTIEFLVKERDHTGGSGANFIVEWFATEEIDPPIIEAVMVGVGGNQGISFRTQGQNLIAPVNQSNPK